jgi:formate-dependent nitrite reductase membrane component NrfD
MMAGAERERGRKGGREKVCTQITLVQSPHDKQTNTQVVSYVKTIVDWNQLLLLEILFILQRENQAFISLF